MKLRRRIGIELSLRDGQPLKVGTLFYWSTSLANVLHKFAGKYKFCPGVQYKPGVDNDFTALFHSNNSENGEELCGTSISLEDAKCRVPKEDVKAFVGTINQLHQIADSPDVPSETKAFAKSFRVPNPKVMKSAWRVSTSGFVRKLLVLWGYETNQSNATVLPLTNTSSTWDDAKDRVDLEKILNEQGAFGGRYDWGKIFRWIFVILCGMLLLWHFLERRGPTDVNSDGGTKTPPSVQSGRPDKNLSDKKNAGTNASSEDQAKTDDGVSNPDKNLSDGKDAGTNASSEDQAKTDDGVSNPDKNLSDGKNAGTNASSEDQAKTDDGVSNPDKNLSDGKDAGTNASSEDQVKTDDGVSNPDKNLSDGKDAGTNASSEVQAKTDDGVSNPDKNLSDGKDAGTNASSEDQAKTDDGVSNPDENPSDGKNAETNAPSAGDSSKETKDGLITDRTVYLIKEDMGKHKYDNKEKSWSTAFHVIERTTNGKGDEEDSECKKIGLLKWKIVDKYTEKEVANAFKTNLWPGKSITLTGVKSGDYCVSCDEPNSAGRKRLEADVSFENQEGPEDTPPLPSPPANWLDASFRVIGTPLEKMQGGESLWFTVEPENSELKRPFEQAFKDGKIRVIDWRVVSKENIAPLQEGNRFPVEKNGLFLAYSTEYKICATVEFDGKRRSAIPYEWNWSHNVEFRIRENGNGSFEVYSPNSSVVFCPDRKANVKEVRWDDPTFFTNVNQLAYFKVRERHGIHGNTASFRWDIGSYVGYYTVCVTAHVVRVAFDGQTVTNVTSRQFRKVHGAVTRDNLDAKIESYRGKVFYCHAEAVDADGGKMSFNGTAFGISKKYLLTNYHVAVGSTDSREGYTVKKVRLEQRDITHFYDVKVIRSDKDCDLALLELTNDELKEDQIFNLLPPDAVKKTLARLQKGKRQIRVAALGYPKGFGPEDIPDFCQGDLQKSLQNESGDLIAAYDIKHGFSGGPMILTESEEIIGVNKAGVETDDVKRGLVDGKKLATSIGEVYRLWGDIIIPSNPIVPKSMK